MMDYEKFGRDVKRIKIFFDDDPMATLKLDCSMYLYRTDRLDVPRKPIRDWEGNEIFFE